MQTREYLVNKNIFIYRILSILFLLALCRKFITGIRNLFVLCIAYIVMRQQLHLNVTYTNARSNFVVYVECEELNKNIFSFISIPLEWLSLNLYIHPFFSRLFSLLSSSCLSLHFLSFLFILFSSPLLSFSFFLISFYNICNTPNFFSSPTSLFFFLFFLLISAPNFAFARQVMTRRISIGFFETSPRTLFLLLTSVHHPSAQSSMISSSQHNRPRFVIADSLYSLTRSLTLTGSRRSGRILTRRERQNLDLA